MCARRMHEHEVETDVSLVRALLAAQLPEWTGLPLEPVESAGTVNALYRLGDDLLVRLPRTDWGVGTVERELRWLPELAPHVPVALPVPLAKGAPAEGYPYEWGVYPWLEGENPTAGAADELARDVARFATALREVDLHGGPPAARGSSLARWDDFTRERLPQLEREIDTEAAAAEWEAALAIPEWSEAPVWTHGDLMPGNLLVQEGRLTAVIDWGLAGMGDPAVDLMVAWNLFDRGSRRVFRDAIDVDVDTWRRGRGWALWTGLLALPYYQATNPELAENGRFRIGEVLSDHRE